MTKTRSTRPRAARQNVPLRRIREAAGLSQDRFAALTGFSRAYVQAVELGERPATRELAERVMRVTGAWPDCIAENWAEAVDLTGEPYTAQTFERFQCKDPEPIDEERVRELLAPMVCLIQSAAGVGKTALAVHLARERLLEASKQILLIDGVDELQRRDSFPVGKLTVGALRKDPRLAAAVGFRDDGSRSDDELIVLQPQGAAPLDVDHLYPKSLVPDAAEIFRKYQARQNEMPATRAVNRSARVSGKGQKACPPEQAGV